MEIANHIPVESLEAEKLRGMIRDKKDYFRKLSNDFAKKKLQSEILFLENTLLPIVLRETVLLYNDVTKTFERGIKKAVDLECDAVVCLVPLKEITDSCMIGVVNPKAQRFGQDNIDSIEIFIDDMSVGGREINVSNIEL